MRQKNLIAANLRYACATVPSVSHFCREHGFNRQQFNRYIAGQARPSPHNLLRIAQAFGLDPRDFDCPDEEFRQCMARPGMARRGMARRGPPAADPDPLEGALPGDLTVLRKYLGFYQTWHVSLSWPDHIVCSCTHLREREGKVLVTSRERIEEPESGIRQHSRYLGFAAYRRGRIFVMESTRGSEPTFGQTVLLPFEMHQRRYLRGLTMGVSWRNDNQPYAARMMWQYLGTRTDLRKLLARRGAYPTASAEVPSAVVNYLSAGRPLSV